MDRRNNCCIYVLLALTFLVNSTLGATLSPPAGLSPGDQFRWLFVTSTDTPDLEDISAFDSYVDTLAAAAGHTTTGITSTPTFSEIVWRAVISTAASGAIPRLSDSGVPVYTLDGDLLGSDLTSLLTVGNTVTEVQNENLASTYGYIITGVASGGGASAYPVPIPFTNSPSTVVTLGVLSESEGWPSTFYNVNAFYLNPEYLSPPFRLYAISEPLTVSPESITVSVDIKPTSCPNPVNVKSKGTLTVAILGTDDFDVSDVDVSTVLLEGVAPTGANYEDVATPVVAEAEPCDCTEEGPDGKIDLVLKFKTQDIVAALGEVSDGDVIVMKLEGTTNDGTAIEGSDCIKIISKGKPD